MLSEKEGFFFVFKKKKKKGTYRVFDSVANLQISQAHYSYSHVISFVSKSANFIKSFREFMV